MFAGASHHPVFFFFIGLPLQPTQPSSFPLDDDFLFYHNRTRGSQTTLIYKLWATRPNPNLFDPLFNSFIIRFRSVKENKYLLLGLKVIDCIVRK